MSDNAIIDDAMAFFHAISALKLKRGVRLVGTPEGQEIHAPGKPVLLLTFSAARDFHNQTQEAEHAL